MYARNLLQLLKPAIKKGELAIDWNDEVFAQSVLTHDGAGAQHEADRRSCSELDDRDGRWTGHMIDGFIALYIFMLAAFTGYEVIARVPVILHTPLMSGSNFVHGIVLVGAMVALGRADTTLEQRHRLHRRRARRRQRRRRLRRHRAHARDVQASSKGKPHEGRALMRAGNARHGLIQASYFVAAGLFIFGLKRMSSPVTARGGIVWAGVGMLVATLITFL